MTSALGRTGMASLLVAVGVIVGTVPIVATACRHERKRERQQHVHG